MKYVDRVVATLIVSGARKATKYVSPKVVACACRRSRPDKRERKIDIVLTLGAPNYAQRKFIKRCEAAGEPFPVRKIQLQFFPPKRRR